LNKHAGWYDGLLGSELGQNVPGDVVEFQTVELSFELPNLLAVGIHLLFGALLVFVDLLYDNFGVTISQQTLDAKCDSDPETMDESFVLGSVVGSLEE
jgi:hypothetical protein